jgi:hypothetical protein
VVTESKFFANHNHNKLWKRCTLYVAENICLEKIMTFKHVKYILKNSCMMQKKWIASWHLSCSSVLLHITGSKVKGKGLPQQAEVARVPGRLRPRIFLTFGTMRVGHQPYAPATFTPGEIPGTHFQTLSRPQGTWFYWGEPWKKSPVTPTRIDPGTVRLVVQCLNHYATLGPLMEVMQVNYWYVKWVWTASLLEWITLLRNCEGHK